MERNTKVILLGCGGLVFVFVLAVVGLAWYAYSNRESWFAEGRAVIKEGTAAGESRSESRCLVDALARHRRDSSLMGAVRTRLWLTSCLKASRVEPAFCDGVPKTDEIFASAQWGIETCAKHGLQSDTQCGNVVIEVTDYCSSEGKAKREESTRQGNSQDSS